MSPTYKLSHVTKTCHNCELGVLQLAYEWLRCTQNGLDIFLDKYLSQTDSGDFPPAFFFSKAFSDIDLPIFYLTLVRNPQWGFPKIDFSKLFLLAFIFDKYLDKKMCKTRFFSSKSGQRFF
jgi:hypothetical protein